MLHRLLILAALFGLTALGPFRASAESSTTSPISEATATQVKMWQHLGRGMVLQSAWRDAQTLLVASTAGFWEYHVGGQEGPFHRFDPIPGTTTIAVYSPDRTLLAVNSDNDVQLWDVASGRLTRTLKSDSPHWQFSLYMAFNRAGQLVVYYGDGTIRLWNSTTGGLLATYHGEKPDNTSFDTRVWFASQYILTYGVNFSVWDTITGQQRILLRPGTDPNRLTALDIDQVIINPDGKTIVTTASSDSHVWLWDIANGQKHELSAQPLADIALSADGKLLLGEFKNQLYLLSVNTGKVQATFSTNKNDPYELDFSPDGKHFLNVGTVGIDVWNTDATGQAIRLPYQAYKLFGGTPFLGFSPDSAYIAFNGVTNEVDISDLSGASRWRSALGPRASTYSYSFAPDNSTLTMIGGDNWATFWDLSTGTVRNAVPIHYNFTGTTFVSADGKTIATQAEGYEGSGIPVADVYDVATGKRIFSGPNMKTLSADGTKFIYWGQDVRVHLYNLSLGKEVLNIAATSVQLSAQPSLLAAVNQGRLELWDATNGIMLAHLDEAQIGKVLGFSEDGKLLVVQNITKDQAFILEVSAAFTFRQIGVVPLTDQVDYVSFSSDDRLIRLLLHSVSSLVINVSADGIQTFGPLYGDALLDPGGKTFLMEMYYFDGRPGQEVFFHLDRKPLTGIVVADSCCAVAYSPDASLLAIGQTDGSINLLQTSTGQLLKALRGGHRGAITYLAFSHDGAILASNGDDDTSVLWTVQ